MNNIEAIFDTLYIGKKLQRKMTDFSLSEILFFSYLSCLLSIYDGKTIDEWNYTFIKSNLGSPYSSDIHLALETLVANNTLSESIESNEYYNVTEKGDEMLLFYQTLSSFSWRLNYLETACKSISLFPFGMVKNSINNEPVLSSARNSLTKRNLLEKSNPATQSLYIQFASLKSALENEHTDLIVPAILWLESLNTNQNA